MALSWNAADAAYYIIFLADLAILQLIVHCSNLIIEGDCFFYHADRAELGGHVEWIADPARGLG